MTHIIGLYKLKLDPADAEKIEAGALLHARYSNITFKVLKTGPDQLIVRATQGKSFHENYADVKSLVQLTRDLFTPFIPVDYILHIDANVYQEAPPEIVTPEWIQKQMNKKKVRLKDLVRDFGIDKATMSGVINGHRELSRFSRAAFYYYFRSW